MSGGRQCARCGSPLAPNAHFCSNCGNSAAAAPGGVGRNERMLWFAAGGLVVALVGGGAVLATRGGGQSQAPQDAAQASDAPFAGGGDAGGGAPPDISNMSPRERFDRLFNRIMSAAEGGDNGTVTRFAPMALAAYSMLPAPDLDADSRYHAALIRMHTGDVDGAAALADTILKKQPGHLFGIILQGTIARFRKDEKAEQQSYKQFLAHYDAEMKAKRPEYAEHQRAVDEFLKTAKASQGQT